METHIGTLLTHTYIQAIPIQTFLIYCCYHKNDEHGHIFLYLN